MRYNALMIVSEMNGKSYRNHTVLCCFIYFSSSCVFCMVVHNPYYVVLWFVCLRHVYPMLPVLTGLSLMFL